MSIESKSAEEAYPLNSLTPEQLIKIIYEKEEEILTLRNDISKAYAENQNQIKRFNRDLEEVKKFGITKLLEALIPIYGNMELAILSSLKTNELTSLLDGCKINLKTFESKLKEFGIVVIDPQKGEAFDPNIHEALALVLTEEIPEGHVYSTHQKGFALNNRVIRPARVSVSKIS